MENIEVIALEENPKNNGFCVAVRRYLLLKGDKNRADKNRLALRLYNYGNFAVTGLRLAVQKVGEDVKPVEELLFDFDDLYAEPNTEFAVRDTFIPSSWTDIHIQIKSVRSDRYEYTLKGENVNIAYSEGRPRVKQLRQVESEYAVFKSSKKYSVLCVLSVCLLIFMALGICFLSGLFQGKKESAERLTDKMVVIQRQYEQKGGAEK